MNSEFNLNSIQIKPMSHDDINFVWEMTKNENWGYINFEIECLFNFQHDAMFIAKYNTQKVGCILGINYETFAFIGNLIVIPEMRKRGIGTRLLDYVITYFEKKHIETIMLDGVPNMIPVYEKMGFQVLCKSLRYFDELVGEEYEEIIPLSKKLWHQCMQLDLELFGANRENLLQQIYNQHPSLCKCYILDGKVVGFVFGINRGILLKVGPLIVKPDIPNPEKLIESLIVPNTVQPIHIGVLESNISAVEGLSRLNLEPKYHSYRMCRGKKRMFPGVFGIAGPDRG